MVSIMGWFWKTLQIQSNNTKNGIVLVWQDCRRALQKLSKLLEVRTCPTLPKNICIYVVGF